MKGTTSVALPPPSNCTARRKRAYMSSLLHWFPSPVRISPSTSTTVLLEPLNTRVVTVSL